MAAGEGKRLRGLLVECGSQVINIKIGERWPVVGLRTFADGERDGEFLKPEIRKLVQAQNEMHKFGLFLIGKFLG